MSESDVLDWRATRGRAVAVRLGSGNACLKWLPAHENLGELRHADAFGAVNRVRISLDDLAPTAHEHAGAPPCLRRLSSHHADATVAALATVFDEHLAPACRQPRTRADYLRVWRLVVKWAVARQAVHDILLMPLDTLDVGHVLLCSPELADRAGVEVCTGGFISASRSVRPTGTHRGSSKMLGLIRGRPLELKMIAWSGLGRKGAVEAIRDFIPQPPGCRQGTSLAPVAWHNCPAAKKGGPSGLSTFGSTTRPRGRGGASASRRGDKRACVHALTRRARISHCAHGTITACTDRSRRARLGARRARLGHGAYTSVTARTLRSRRARLARCARCAARQVLWAQRARRPRRCDYYNARSGVGGEAAAGGGS
jgi:hypothetical protein